MGTWLLVCLMMVAAAAPARGAAQQGADGAPLEILHGFTLIDGRGGTPVPDAALAIRGDLIVAAGPRVELLRRSEAAGENAILVDLGGGYVVPGLIDTHVHLATVPNRSRAEAELYRALYSGVTAVRDMAGDARALASLARDARLGEIEAPDVFYSALMAGPSFFADPRPQSSAAGEKAGRVPWMQAVTVETDLSLAVALARGTSASGIKIYANLEAGLVERITAEAHRQGMIVWAHSMVFPARPLEVVRAGVDVISHACRLAWEGMAAAPGEYHHERVPDYTLLSVDAPIYGELFREMRSRGTILDATLALYTRADRMRAEDPEAGTPVRCDTDFARALVRRAYAEGVPVTAGTDFANDPEEPFPSLHDELAELVEHVGMSPLGAIEAATRVAARALGIDATHGTLEPGRVVNFVLLGADPLADITNLESVREVWKNAERFPRSEYQPRAAPGTGGGARSGGWAAASGRAAAGGRATTGGAASR